MLFRWQYRKSSGWHTAVSLGHSDEIWPRAKSSGWPRYQITLCHPDVSRKLRMSSGWPLARSISHPDEILPIVKSSGWLCVQVPLCHPDDFLHNGSVASRIWYHESLTHWLSALLALCEGNPIVMLCFDIFVVGLDKLLNKQSKCRWVQTPWSLCDVNAITESDIIMLEKQKQTNTAIPLVRWNVNNLLQHQYNFYRFQWNHCRIVFQIVDIPVSLL